MPATSTSAAARPRTSTPASSGRPFKVSAGRIWECDSWREAHASTCAGPFAASSTICSATPPISPTTSRPRSLRGRRDADQSRSVRRADLRRRYRPGAAADYPRCGHQRIGYCRAPGSCRPLASRREPAGGREAVRSREDAHRHVLEDLARGRSRPDRRCWSGRISAPVSSWRNVRPASSGGSRTRDVFHASPSGGPDPARTAARTGAARRTAPRDPRGSARTRSRCRRPSSRLRAARRRRTGTAPGRRRRRRRPAAVMSSLMRPSVQRSSISASRAGRSVGAQRQHVIDLVQQRPAPRRNPPAAGCRDRPG